MAKQCANDQVRPGGQYAGRGTSRPTAYRPEFKDHARKLAKLGATIIEMADFFEVDQRTIRRWRLSHPDFDEALKTGTEVANLRVQASLFQQATGYWLDTEETRVINGKVVRIPTKTWYPPTVTAKIYWTKVKMGWRDDGLGEKPMDRENAPQESIRHALLLHQAGRGNEVQ